MIDPPAPEPPAPEPPAPCITALAAWAQYMGASRLRAITCDTNRGEASAAGTAGEPPALLTSTSTRPKRSAVACTTEAACSRVADVGGEEHGPAAVALGQLVHDRLVAPADGHLGPGPEEGLGDAATHPPAPARDDDDFAGEVDGRVLAHAENLANVFAGRRCRRGRPAPLDASKSQEGDSQEGKGVGGASFGGDGGGAMRATTRPASPVSLAYLPGLDGIRGVAVVAVIATHTVATIPGGFLSVDVFFALSGYLITSLLVAEWRQSDGISLGRFWSRRARRLLPALFLMLTAVGAGAALWPQIFDSPSLRGDTLATVFYVANWHFIADHTNYFLAAGQASPLLHTWSLAIEEQFYLVWPIVVLAVFKLRRPWRRAAGRDDGGGLRGRFCRDSSPTPSSRALLHRRHRCIGLGGVDGGADPAGGDTTRSFYASDTRAQAILVGAALAVGSVLWGPARSRRARAAVWGWGVAGVAGTALLWSLVPPNSLLVFRGGFFVAALCTAGIIACVANLPTSRLATVLCFGPLRYIGRISYGMYLWYWPLVLVFSSTRTHLEGYPLLGVRMVAIISVATASAYLVELPIRRGHLPGWWAPLAMPIAASLAVLTTFTATVGVSDVAAASVSANGNAPATASAAGSDTGSGVASDTGSGAASGAGSGTTTTSPEPVKVLIVGDSVAGTLGVGLGQVMSQYGVEAVNEGSPGCSVSMDQLVKVLWFTDPPGKPCVNDDPECLVRAVARLGGRVQSRRRHLHGPQRRAEPGGGLELDEHRRARLRLLSHEPVPRRHRCARLTRRARGPARPPRSTTPACNPAACHGPRTTPPV